MWFFEKEESRWRKNPLLRCRRVCNGHNSCPRRSPRSCSSDEFFFNCRSFLRCFTSFTWWSLCPGSWAQWGRSWSRTSSRPPAPGPAVSATPFMQTLLIVCKPIRGREGKGSSLKKKRCSMSQGVAADLNRNKAACVFLTYSKSKSWPQIYKLWVIRIPVAKKKPAISLEMTCLSVWLSFSGQHWVLWQCHQSKTFFPYFLFMKQDRLGWMLHRFSAIYFESTDHQDQQIKRSWWHWPSPLSPPLSILEVHLRSPRCLLTPVHHLSSL